VHLKIRLALTTRFLDVPNNESLMQTPTRMH
jgi:hypothetical protein